VSHPRVARLYVWSVIGLGAAAALEAVWRLGSDSVSPQWLVLAVLTVLSSSIAVKVPLVPATVSVSETFLFAAVLLFGPAAGTLIATLDGLVISLWLQRRKRNVTRLLFNMAAPALAISPAAHLYAFLAPMEARGRVTDLLPAVAVFASVYFVLNTWLVTMAIANETDTPPFEIWREHFLGVSINYFGGASVALLLVGLGREVTLQAVLAIVPLLGISYLTIKTTQKRVEEAHGHLAELRELHRSTIETLAMAVDAKDQVTHGHIRRVQADAVALSRALGIEGPVLQAIEAAALLHDMGKLSVPEHILNKPGKLTPAEFDIMKRHASHGADMLSAIKFPYPVVPIVRHHHEEWNGRGYPAGLKGNDIPIGARILSVVDCFDALTSDRPYRPRLSDEEALAFLRGRRGSAYDPTVVDVFLEIYPAIAAGRSDLSGSPSGVPCSSHVPEAPALTPAGPTRPTGPAAPSSPESWASAEASVLAGDLARELDLHPDLSSALEATVEHLTRRIPASLAVVYLHELTSDSLLAVHATGESAALVVGTRMRIGERITGWVAANHQSILSSDPVLDLGEIARAVTPAVQRCLSVPLVHAGSLVGAVSIYAPQTPELTDYHRRIAEAVLDHVAPAIKLRADATLLSRREIGPAVAFAAPSTVTSTLVH
jgi:putative nucleotidyltransferase with HDIG domain